VSSTSEVSFSGGSGARGRNNWFRLWKGRVSTEIPRGQVTVDLFSIREGRTAPVVLRLNPRDALRLADALRVAAHEAIDDLDADGLLV